VIGSLLQERHRLAGAVGEPPAGKDRGPGQDFDAGRGIYRL